MFLKIIFAVNFILIAVLVAIAVLVTVFILSMCGVYEFLFRKFRKK